MAKRDLTEVEQAYEEYEHEEHEERRHAVYNRRRFEGLQIDPDVDFYPEVADREPGDTNIEKYGFDLHPQVTFWAAGFLVVFIAYTLIFQEQASAVFESILAFVNDSFGWFYILSANIFVLACLFFAFSRYGKIRIGGPEAKPEFTNVAWYAMLLSAGMGIGLMFWSVAEPIFHLSAPPPLFNVDPNTGQAASAALATTYFHWGIHPWGIYALVSLALAFFAYNRGLPLTFRSVFYPLLGKKIYGNWGNLIDVLTVLATLFGLATSLGFGVGQAAAGLNYLFGWPSGTPFQVLLIAIITGMATMSVVAGLDGGVKRLSQLNMGLAGAFLLFMIIVGPTLFLLSVFVESLGTYVFVLPELSFYNEAFSGTDWQGSWTVFYWGWWISWSPFVGMFIARVSKGRSVRELILGVMIVPSLLSFFWMAIFGGTALNLQLTGARDVATAVNEDVATAMFDMFQALPLSTITSIFAVILVVGFFVTSSDSGSLVVDHLTSGGKLDSPKPQRIFWAVMEGTIAAVLLIGGGLSALQTAAVATGLPFAIVLLVMIWSLRTAFHEELDLLEGHYDAAEFRAQHGTLLERIGAGRRRRGEAVAPQEGGSS
ncbi:BCCT family transporter [Salsipaludibacter albus]|uniref:BCCT family transporter n=1 Tax=Salsipaludibacter albus TaxID=2849650 RepID=UPI001EE4D7AE|nr:BCCT family transporter [Salsipaludibacter albus]MBY5163758.1 BCCT family transporter [Salsipaludibacter albus]